MKKFFEDLLAKLFGKQTADTIIGGIDRKVAKLRSHADKHADLAENAQIAAANHYDEATRAGRIADRFAAITD